MYACDYRQLSANEGFGLVIEALSIERKKNPSIGVAKMNIGRFHREDDGLASAGKTPDALGARRDLDRGFVLFLIEKGNLLFKEADCPA